jgi:1,4-dihydroxy-2-naphthoyl-CoA hydrolase
MAIWFDNYSIADLNKMCENTIHDALGIQFTEIGNDYITATMPVDTRTVQPIGLLHGGATVVLAESLGSIGAYLVIDPKKYSCVGIEVNANHVRGVRRGIVTGTARPVHLGKTTQIWDIKVVNEPGHLVCVSRLTLAILENEA